MTIGNALSFIDRGQKDEALRQALNKAETMDACNVILACENLKFSSFEFEEAFSFRLFKCLDYEKAQQLQAFKIWWDLLCRSHSRPEKERYHECTNRIGVY